MSDLLKIRFDSIDKVKRFVNICTRSSCDVDVKSDRYIINGKSIMGIFSLDLTQVVDVIIHSDNISDVDSLKLELESEGMTK